MTGLLLAAALVFDCTFKSVDVENGGKIYNYGYSPREQRELRVADKVYQCTEDHPSMPGVGIKTLNRKRCGPLTLFFQSYRKQCDYDDYNPSPSRFNSLEDGKRLLRVQHDCIKDGMKFVAAWHKMRDRNGVEWDINVRLQSSAVCSATQRVEMFKEVYKVEKTGDVLEYTHSYAYPIKSIENYRAPSF